MTPSISLPDPVPQDMEAVQRNFDKFQRAWDEQDPYHEVGATGEPAFANSWVNAGGTDATAAFYRHQDEVRLKGTIDTGTIGQTAFTLPVNYRPALNEIFAVVSNGTIGGVTVNSDGTVVPGIGNNAYVSLSNIKFRVA